MENNKIRCLVVDDEPLAAEVLEKYISQLDSLTLVGKCSHAIEALDFLQQHKVDLLFLDIQMPRLSGIDFIRTLQRRPKVILTTAFRDYAVEGFELNVLDYLVKPIPFERFLGAINKYHAARETAVALPTVVTPPVSGIAPDAFIYLKADKKMVKVFLKDILYIESLKDYVKVKTVEKEIITWQRISYLEEKLPDENFLRIHRSYIVAMNKIKSFNAAFIEIGDQELPIGRQYKAGVMKALGFNEQA
ncbi:DNA-binding response regulator [Paraflavitalea soli]|uniref:DNA-binding response regulator n=1 Tax=Paraflavitalea soli TaxID=2315862 RepID=A0A3B7MJ98_9BACT|nr:LytTR family DNA-binding domain-containing protein [Paraflavitalea soli]AXY74502.1 DNA-binding response regulator [Paraflavitalea soli]